METNKNSTLLLKSNLRASQTERNLKVSFTLIPTSRNTRRKSVGSLIESFDNCNNSTKITKQEINRKRPSIFYLDNANNFKGETCDIRHDAYGNIINKGSKSHKVSFKDMVSTQNIAEIVIYDRNEKEEKIKDKELCNCVCLII